MTLVPGSEENVLWSNRVLTGLRVKANDPSVNMNASSDGNEASSSAWGR